MNNSRITSGDRIKDLVISTTGELETSLVSLIIYKNGDPEQMIEGLQIIANDFKTKLFTNIINMLAFLDNMVENPENTVIIDALEEEVGKARKKTLLFQMRTLLSSKIKGLVDSLNKEKVQEKRQELVNQLSIVNDSMHKIQKNLEDGRLELENSVLGIEKSSRKDLQSLFKNEILSKGFNHPEGQGEPGKRKVQVNQKEGAFGNLIQNVHGVPKFQRTIEEEQNPIKIIQAYGELAAGSEKLFVTTPKKHQNLPVQNTSKEFKSEEGFHNPITNSPLINESDSKERSNMNSHSKIFKMLDVTINSGGKYQASSMNHSDKFLKYRRENLLSSSKKFENIAASPLAKAEADDTQSMNNTICKFLDRIEGAGTQVRPNLLASASVISFDEVVHVERRTSPANNPAENHKKNRKTLSFTAANTGKGASSKRDGSTKSKKNGTPLANLKESKKSPLIKDSSETECKVSDNKENKMANKNSGSPKIREPNKLEIKYPAGIKHTDTPSSETKQVLVGKKITNSVEFRKLN